MSYYELCARKIFMLGQTTYMPYSITLDWRLNSSYCIACSLSYFAVLSSKCLPGLVYCQTGDLSYVHDIRQRMEQDQVSRREREKRRRKILAEQLEALRQQQEANRENLLVERLMRQCVQEKRIATQLMQIRKEKEVIRNNRLVAVAVVPLVSCWECCESFPLSLCVQDHASEAV